MLKSTRITFTNSGNRTITYDDFAKYAQLVIKVTKCFLCNEAEFQIEKDNQNLKTSIKFLEENSVWFYFDFLKQKESVTVTFYHEGDIHILGELTSGKIQEKETEISDRVFFFHLILFLIFFICLVLYWLCSLIFPIEGFQFVLSAVMIFVFVVGMIYPLIWFIRWLPSRVSSIFSRKNRKNEVQL